MLGSILGKARFRINGLRGGCLGADIKDGTFKIMYQLYFCDFYQNI